METLEQSSAASAGQSKRETFDFNTGEFVSD